MTWLSPAFPVGAFSYSHGLEFAIDTGTVHTGDDLEGWVADLLEVGSGWSDAVLLAESWRAGRDADAGRLTEVAELAAAMAPSRERHLETTGQGAAFQQAVAGAWPGPTAAALLEAKHATAYPVAVGAVAGEHALPLEPVLAAFLNGFAANLASVAVRLVPLGQTEGLRVMAALHPLVEASAARAALSDLDDLGSATILSDVASMRHETQYSRVFRT